MKCSVTYVQLFEGAEYAIDVGSLNTITNRERMADVGNPAISAVEDCTELAELGNGLEPGISRNAATTPTFFIQGDGKAGWVDVAIYKLRACNNNASFV